MNIIKQIDDSKNEVISVMVDIAERVLFGTIFMVPFFSLHNNNNNNSNNLFWLA